MSWRQETLEPCMDHTVQNYGNAGREYTHRLAIVVEFWPVNVTDGTFTRNRRAAGRHSGFGGKRFWQMATEAVSLRIYWVGENGMYM